MSRSTDDGNEQATEPQRVFIVGGGVAALTTAYWLTEQSTPCNITLFQPGWRLGGKLATGRNEMHGDRIEEHGLHILSGFYENTFAVLRGVYDALDRPPDHPLATWKDAFAKWDDVSWGAVLGGHMTLFSNKVPGNDAEPGSGGRLAPPAELLARILPFGVKLLAGAQPPKGAPVTEVPILPVPVSQAFAPIGEKPSIGDMIDWAFGGFESVLGSTLLTDALEATPEIATSIITPIRSAVHWWLDRVLTDHPAIFEALVLVDTLLAYVEGFFHERVFSKGFDVLNGTDYRTWMRACHVHEVTLQSGFVQGAYTYVFAYRQGNPERPDLDAGVAIRMLFRLLMAASGAVFWRMNAGSGDSMIAPLYELLDQRGVNFEFFSRATSIDVDHASARVTGVTIGRQATVNGTAGGPGHYQPLRPLSRNSEVHVWPSEPLYDQLVEGEQLRAERIDLESHWTTWTDVATDSFVRGRDFDVVVLAASLGAVPDVAPQAVAASPALQRVIDDITTVRTQALQIALDLDTAQLGGPDPPTIATALNEPLDTWADMSFLLHEPAGDPPSSGASIHYLCGTLLETEDVPNPPAPNYPRVVDTGATATARQWLADNGAHLWPRSAQPGAPDAFDFERLVSQSSDSMNSQYVRANIDPTSTYNQSPAGSTPSRLTADGSGIDGLVLTGDWTRTGLDYGCVEAAVMSGLSASRAICGSPEHIYGESDFPPFAGPTP